MHEVGTDGVAPTHVAPFVAERIVLEEEMVFAFEIDEPIRIVGPVPARREMKLRPERLIVSGRDGAGTGRKGQERGENNVSSAQSSLDTRPIAIKSPPLREGPPIDR